MVLRLKVLPIFSLNIIFTCALALASQPTLPKAPYVFPQVVKQWQAEKRNVILIDVREPKEYEAGHIEGAVNIPFKEVEPRAGEFIKGEEPSYVFYCISSSWRAPYSANTLADLGYHNVYTLEGGISAWNAGGQVIYASQANVMPAVIPYSPDLDKTLQHPPDRKYKEKIKLTLEELSHYDGKDGHPAYVAVDGVIYDLTESRLWRGGEHDPSHGEAKAGRDLTKVIKQSPHGKKNLKRFPVVGRLINFQKE